MHAEGEDRDGSEVPGDEEETGDKGGGDEKIDPATDKEVKENQTPLTEEEKEEVRREEITQTTNELAE